MTTQHTPGPWAVSTLPKAYSVRRVDSSGVIASVARSSNDDRDEICYSDARLIAAAPDLAKAGKPFAEACEMFAWPVYAPDEHVISPELRLTVGDLRKMRAALTKAGTP